MDFMAKTGQKSHFSQTFRDGKQLTKILVYANITDVMEEKNELFHTSRLPSTRQKLLDAGREEFYRYGYQKASLRRIYAACGVTTGAFYFFFENKDALFCQIVDPVIQTGIKLAEKLNKREQDDLSTSPDNDRQMMEFELKYRREFLMLLEGSQGSSRENFKEFLFDTMTHYFTEHFAFSIGRQPNPEIMKLLVTMRLAGNLALLKGDYDMEQIFFLNDMLSCYAKGGFQHLLDNFKDRL